MLAFLFILLCFFSFRVVLTMPNSDTLPTLHAKLTPTSAQPHVLFAAHSTALLFINGQLKSRAKSWDHVGSVQHALKYGDVISIYASGSSSSNQGLIAAVYLGNPTHGVVHTGDGNWKAIALSRHTWNHARHWTGKDGSSCRWPAPKTTLIRKYYHRQLLSFPMTASVVWANAAKSRTPVLFRYVVGGEKCNRKSAISFASKDIAWLYVDGKFQASVSRWNQIKTVHAKLTKGTVIALKVRGKKKQQGVVVDISLNAEHHIVTGQHGWTAIRGHMKEGKDPHGWKSGQFSSCHWPPAVVLSNHPQRRMNLKFHDREGARYVWTDGKGEQGVMLLRYVVGGERCESQTKIFVRSRPSSWIYINGRLLTYVKAGGQETVYRQLSKGDVIGVLSKGRRNIGVQIAMNGPQGAWYSGGLGWKGLMGRSPQGWKMKSYSSCSWRSAVVLKEVKNRHATRSKIIWASGGRPGISLLRFVVGGEDCAIIKFESPGRVRLYVNGRSRRASSMGRFTWFVQTSLKIGDVVGIVGYPSRTEKKNWVRAVVHINDRFYPTGSRDWRVAQLPADSAWTSRKYNACKWPAGNIVGGFKRLGNSPVLVRALWANEGAVALRFAVGGGGCEPEQVPQIPDEPVRKAELGLSSDNEASLFVNGKLVLRTDSWRSVAKVVFHVKHGDVFVVHARDGGFWFGLRVSLLVDGNEMGTGVGDWRMRGTRNVDKAWTSPGFNGCNWPKPVRADGGSLFETEVPKIHGQSHHVWAKDTNIGDDVVARFVLGGSC